MYGLRVRDGWFDHREHLPEFDTFIIRKQTSIAQIDCVNDA